MNTYYRKSSAKAIQFFERDFHQDPFKYVAVFDKATLSSVWADKSAKDGRYLVKNQTNTVSFNSTITVGEGDYIIDENGVFVVIPEACFNETYILSDKNKARFPIYCTRCEVYIGESESEETSSALCKECYYGKLKTLESSN